MTDDNRDSGIINNVKERIKVYTFITKIAWAVLVQGKPTMDKIVALLKSHRFWMAVAGVVAVALKDTIGLDETQTLAVASIIVGWIVGETIRPNLPKPDGGVSAKHR